MASIRRGYSDDFTLKNNSVGIGTSTGQGALDVIDGAVKGQDLKVTGISSFTAYEGFLRADHQIAENTTLSFDQGPVSSLSGEIIVGTGKTVTVNEVVKETAGVGNGSNNEWYSLSGSYTFKANGDPTWDGSAFVYDGTGDYHQLNSSGSSSTPPDSTFEVGSSNFTLEQWVYITSASSICSTFFSKGNDNSVGTEFMSLQTTGANTIPGFFFGSGSTLLSGSAVGTGEWHHYVVTRSGNNFTLYVDGTSVDTATSSSSLASGITGGINIGAQSYSVSTDGRKLNGKISITRLYSGRVLTAAEVTLNYNAGHTATTSAVAATVDLNANNPLSYPGTVRDVDTTDFTRAGGSEIECLKVYNTFTPPSGGTNERPYAPKPGELYYNYDFKTIEFFDGNGWRQVDNTTRSGRTVIAGGGGGYKTIHYVQTSSLGNSVYFGELSLSGGYGGSAMSNGIRGLTGGGWDGANNNNVEYVTLASGGNGIDFGADTDQGWGPMGASTSTRGISAGGGYPSANTTIKSFFFSSTGVREDFGNLPTGIDHRGMGDKGPNSPTRGLFCGGYYVRRMESKELHSDGDTVFFGDLVSATRGAVSASDQTRGILFSGWDGASYIQKVDYVTMASFGNAVEFGDMDLPGYGASGGNMTRALYFRNNEIQYVEIQSQGNAVDFGDIGYNASIQALGLQDSHGGLGGF